MGVEWGGSFVKSGMKWTFDVRFVAGLERDIQPAFSWLGPSTALREAPLTHVNRFVILHAVS